MKNLQERRDAKAEYMRSYRAKERDRCRAIMRKASKKWRTQHPDKFRDNVLRTRYGITLEEYNEMFLRQGRACAICKTTKGHGGRGMGWHVDHCHDTHRVRGILCGKCNVMLGVVQSALRLWPEIVEYLGRV